MCGRTGILLFLAALWAAKADIARAGRPREDRSLEQCCVSHVPLAVFRAEHLSGARFIMLGVPSYMPWRLFWAYFVGLCCSPASLSIATKIQVRWSGCLFGIMMFLFVAMVHIPRVLAGPSDRIHGRLSSAKCHRGRRLGFLRERDARQGKSKLITVGRVLIRDRPLYFLAWSIFCTRRDAPESRSKNLCPRGFRGPCSLGI